MDRTTFTDTLWAKKLAYDLDYESSSRAIFWSFSRRCRLPRRLSTTVPLFNRSCCLAFFSFTTMAGRGLVSKFFHGNGSLCSLSSGCIVCVLHRACSVINLSNYNLINNASKKEYTSNDVRCEAPSASSTKQEWQCCVYISCNTGKWGKFSWKKRGGCI